jgi:pyruvate/2-oxoglutarate dehydrogenase complex dihydrolipoamide dehydrogenase (E3) component
MSVRECDVLVIGAGPAGTTAATRAAELGARTILIACDDFGGMAANQGPIPVRTLAHAARLAREAAQLEQYGIRAEPLGIDYNRLLARAREVVEEARRRSTLLQQLLDAGAELIEHAGMVRFVDTNTVTSESGWTLRAKKIVIASGGISRPLGVPGEELSVTPADAFGLRAVPGSMLVIGAGATGAQVASIFNAFGSKMALCQAGPRIIASEDAEVSAEVARTFRDDGITVHEDCGPAVRLDAVAGGVRTTFRNGLVVEAELAVRSIGWIADTDGLNAEAAGVRINRRGFIEVNRHLRTSAPHIFAAGDVIGGAMLVPQAVRDGYLAGNNAVAETLHAVPADVDPIGSFTDPEYAKVGLTEEQARQARDVLVSRSTYEETTRPIIDGRTRGFCKLVIDRASLEIIGCHIVGERAVEVAQMASIAMTAGMSVADVARIPFSFPTYANVFGRAALRALYQLGAPLFVERV